jgi:phosphatidylglycerophosphatase A
MKNLQFFKIIATLGFIGYLPIAPGTFGTLAAFLIYILIKPTIFINALIALILIPISIAASHLTEILLNEKDSRHIVIDEFCGYFCSLLFIPFDILYALAGFFLFRIFDILKPFPIRKIERLFKGGKGIVADDIIAAFYTNIILQAWKIIP